MSIHLPDFRLYLVALVLASNCFTAIGFPSWVARSSLVIIPTRLPPAKTLCPSSPQRFSMAQGAADGSHP
jgi:hypothetical protein